jgi:hypothetical protein
MISNFRSASCPNQRGCATVVPECRPERYAFVEGPDFRALCWSAAPPHKGINTSSMAGTDIPVVIAGRVATRRTTTTSTSERRHAGLLCPGP